MFISRIIIKVFLLGIFAESIGQTQEKDLAPFLESTEHINSDHPTISKKANELTADCSTKVQKAKVLYEFVRDWHKEQHTDSFVASDILKGCGEFCYQKSILLAALCRSQDIPSRLHIQKVTIKDYKTQKDTQDIAFAHLLTGVYIKGDWHVYETVGNKRKWTSWNQNPEVGKDMPVEFHPDRDCLFGSNDKVKLELLPVHFNDWNTRLTDEIKNIDGGIYLNGE